MASTWYRAGGYGKNPIEPVEVVKETERQVWYISMWMGRPKEERAAKRGSYHSFFPTWEEAKAFIVSKAERDVERNKEALQMSRSRLGQVQSLRKPEPA